MFRLTYIPKAFFHYVSVGLTGVFFVLSGCTTNNKSSDFDAEAENRAIPQDWMYQQRSYPYGIPDVQAHQQAISFWQNHQTALSLREEQPIWQSVGPNNIGGRVTDIEMPHNSLSTIYVAAASGGIFKSTDTGQTWLPIFDDFGVLAVGDLAIDQQNPATIYAGTGEPNAGGGSVTYEGKGLFRSRDSGKNWQTIGLNQSGSIGRIVIDPRRPQRLFAAAMGSMFRKNTERGIFRSTDDGQQWERVLYLSDSTGGIDLSIHPFNTDTLYAAMWERVRRADYRSYGGSTSGIFRSYDGGNTWQELTKGLPARASQKGRIGIAVAPSKPSTIFAVYATQDGDLQGVYRSDDGGDLWTEIPSVGVPDPGFMWWFGRIWVHPLNHNKIYIAGLELYTNEGGDSWRVVFDNAHVDHHALFFHPQDPNFMLNGNDGGVYLSRNGGREHSFLSGLPITQFYTVHADRLIPDRVYGGTQDNASLRTDGDAQGWEHIWVGDGFTTLSDPTNANIIYTESQYGYFVRSTNGGAQFFAATKGISPEDRRNWHTPFTLDPSKPFTLYLGTNRMYQSTDRALNWFPISGDLTDNQRASVTYNTITTIDVSPINSSILYCGTDDGRVWAYAGNNNWTEVTQGLPKRWVTRVVADPRDYLTVYVTLSGYKWGDRMSHVYKSISNGYGWQSIGTGLPDVPVNDLVVIEHLNWLVVATDAGIYYSNNDGRSWMPLGQELPPVVVNDLDFHEPSLSLYAGTYGRSIMKLDLSGFNTTSTVRHEKELNIQIYPNPALDVIGIKVITNEQNGAGTLKILDILGREIYSDKVRSLHNVQIPLHTIPAGPYFLQLKTSQGQKTLKFLKE